MATKTIFKGVINGQEFDDVKAYNKQLMALLEAGETVEAHTTTETIQEEPTETKPNKKEDNTTILDIDRYTNIVGNALAGVGDPTDTMAVMNEILGKIDADELPKFKSYILLMQKTATSIQDNLQKELSAGNAEYEKLDTEYEQLISKMNTMEEDLDEMEESLEKTKKTLDAINASMDFYDRTIEFLNQSAGKGDSSDVPETTSYSRMIELINKIFGE